MVSLGRQLLISHRCVFLLIALTVASKSLCRDEEDEYLELCEETRLFPVTDGCNGHHFSLQDSRLDLRVANMKYTLLGIISITL